MDTGVCWGVEKSMWFLPSNNGIKEVTRFLEEEGSNI